MCVYAWQIPWLGPCCMVLSRAHQAPAPDTVTQPWPTRAACICSGAWKAWGSRGTSGSGIPPATCGLPSKTSEYRCHLSVSLSGVSLGQELNVVMSVQHACQLVGIKSQRNIISTGIMNDIAQPCSKCKLHPGQNHQPTPTNLTGSLSKDFIGPCPHLTGGKGTWSCWNDMNTEALNTCWTVRDQFTDGCAVLSGWHDEAVRLYSQ